MKRNGALAEKEKKTRGSRTESVSLEKRPEVQKLLAQVPTVEFGKVNELAQSLANEIYAQMQEAGLYSHGAEAFEIDTNQRGGVQKEKIVPGSELSQVMYGVFRLTQILNSFKFALRGTVVLNTCMTYLGMRIVSDPQLQFTPNRRQLLIEGLDLYYMPTGLYQGASRDEVEIDSILPQLFFDITEVERDIAKLRFKKHTKVDTDTYAALVTRLEQMVRRYPNDNLVQDWCTFKLKELDRLSVALKKNWLEKPEYITTRQIPQARSFRRRR